MKKKLRFRKRLCCSVAALSWFAMCGNMHAADNVLKSVQDVKSGITAPDFTLAANEDLVGTWIIDQVTIKKTVNDVPSEKTYSLKQRQKIESFADCPKKIIFKADGKMIFEYDGKEASEDSYTVEGNQIIRMTPAALYKYEYTITDANKIQLLYSIDYVHNSGNKIDRITEEYTFSGTKQ